jgi:hypothetical protein
MYRRSDLSRSDLAPLHPGGIILVRHPHAASFMLRLAYPKRSRRCSASPIAFSDQTVTAIRPTHNRLQQYCCRENGDQGEESRVWEQVGW